MKAMAVLPTAVLPQRNNKASTWSYSRANVNIKVLSTLTSRQPKNIFFLPKISLSRGRTRQNRVQPMKKTEPCMAMSDLSMPRVVRDCINILTSHVHVLYPVLETLGMTVVNFISYLSFISATKLIRGATWVLISHLIVILKGTAEVTRLKLVIWESKD